MKHYLIALNGCGELLKRKFKSRSLFDYARKENFDKLSVKGNWGYLYLGQTFESAYYNLFDEGKNFPGESFIRAHRFKIPLHKSQTSFLAGFMMQVDGRVLESEVKLSEKETSGLLDALSCGGKNFEFHIRDGQVILVFNKEFPEETVLFPCNIKGRDFASHLYRNRECEEINHLISSSTEVLASHPINKVREDLGELSANLLWLWGLGRIREIVPTREKFGKKTFFFPAGGDTVPPAELFGFKKIAGLGETEKDSFIWINDSINVNDGPALWLKQFENFDREVLGEVLREYAERKCRVLFIFDGFLSPDTEIKNGWGVFMMLSEKPFSKFRLKKHFRNGRIFIEKFLT